MQKDSSMQFSLGLNQEKSDADMSKSFTRDEEEQEDPGEQAELEKLKD